MPLSKNGIIAGSMLVFIPAVGEFVIPELLGGPETLMIGKVLWQEFFNNRDWPVASALAVIMLIILMVPDHLVQPQPSQGTGGQGYEALQFLQMSCSGWAWPFIYLPMLILVIYSFNASKLVTVWGGWSIKWYAGLLDNSQLMGSVMRSLEIAFYTAIAAVALGTLAAFVLTRIAALQGPYPVRWPGYRAAGDARSDHRSVAAAAVRGNGPADRLAGSERGLVTIWIAHTTFCSAYVAVVVSFASA